MTRSSRATSPQRPPASHRARGKGLREASITRLGITCFRLVALDDAALGFTATRLVSSTAAMAALARPRETRRERSPRRVTRVTVMDRVIRETLAQRPAIAG